MGATNNQEIVMYIVCAHCASNNRVPEERLKDHPACGSCKQALLPVQPIAHGDATLPAFLRAARQPVLVDFWASWCGPCRAFAPAFAQAAAQNPPIHFAKVDVDSAPQVSAQCSIRSVPTAILFVDAEEVARFSGAMSAAQLGQWLQQQLRSR